MANISVTATGSVGYPNGLTWVHQWFRTSQYLGRLRQVYVADPANNVDLMAIGVAKTSQVQWVGWFSIGGVKLDAKQTNSAEHELVVTPDAGERVPRVCGDDDFPADADRVKERGS